MDAPLDTSVDAGLFDLTADSLPDAESPAGRFCFALDAPDLAMDFPPVLYMPDSIREIIADALQVQE